MAILSPIAGCVNSGTVPVPYPCSPVNIPVSYAYYVGMVQPPAVTNASCTGLPGTPTGSVTGGMPITICCTP
jgi:hypothetical protein